ncbi:MAG: hypothetical protein CMB80_25975 [Flammeovirgaceae bacterium]|nr:hypothetical protein [Flammeovirgaceae bacterium]
MQAQERSTSSDLFRVKPVITVEVEEDLPFPDMPELEAEATIKLQPDHMRNGLLISPENADNAFGHGFKLYSGNTLILEIDKGLNDKTAQNAVKSWEQDGSVQFGELLYNLRTGELVNNIYVKEGINRKCYVKFNSSDNSRKTNRGNTTYLQVAKILDRNNCYVQLEGHFDFEEISTLFYLANRNKAFSILNLPLYDLIKNSNMNRMGFGKANKTAVYFFEDQHFRLTEGDSSQDYYGYEFERAMRELIEFLDFKKG